MLSKEEKLNKIINYVKNKFETDITGHDFHHMQRVARLAAEIAEIENADVFITEASAWLHDIGDHKLFADPNSALKNMNKLLETLAFNAKEINQINQILAEISFSKGVHDPSTIEAKIVQDADRLDAIGAIGIARTFAYGGAKGQAIFDADRPENTSFQHFYDKLLHLKKSMHTEYAKKMAEARNDFLKKFVEQFKTEWGN